MQMRRRSGCIALLVSAPLVWGCGADDGERPPAVAAAAPGEAAARAGAPLPPAGEVRVSLDAAGLATVLASAAPRGAIVSALAERGEFGVMIGEEARLDERLTVQIARSRRKSRSRGCSPACRTPSSTLRIRPAARAASRS